jgi:DNA phosphorothioation-dependent restriction protein DptH
VLDPEALEPLPGTLPPAFAERRRRLFDQLHARRPRFAVETLHWDDELREEAIGYCQAYRRALDSATDPEVRNSLLTLDTVRLSVDTAGHAPIAAVIALLLQPLRLAWARPPATGRPPGSWPR